jgi:hypothetical protein
MTQLSLQLAATHDHWRDERASRHVIAALQLWWRHFAKRHPLVADGLEWTSCGVIALAMLVGTLIANA